MPSTSASWVVTSSAHENGASSPDCSTNCSSSSDPWAKRREVAPWELASEPLLLREQGSATRLVTERTLRQAGVKFTMAMELDHIEAIKQAVMAGLGIAFVSIYAVAVKSRRDGCLRYG
jgi:DNA-binding transcriptional LysR family regulator